MNQIEKFKSRFSEEVLDMMVLTLEAVSGGIVIENYLRPSMNFAASVDMDTGVLSNEVGRLEWLVKKGTENKWGFNFEQYKIYRIKARKNIPVELNENMSKVMNNCYMVLEVTDMNATEPRLEKMSESASKTAILDANERIYNTLMKLYTNI